MRKEIVLVILLLALGMRPAAGQNRFGAGLVVGLNASQIDGDFYAGYDRLALYAGARALIYLTDRTEVSFELAYSQRGSQSELSPGNTSPPFKLKTDYIEVPIHYHFKDWQVDGDDGDYYRVNVFGGLTYSRLFQSELDDGTPSQNLVDVTDFFQTNDIAANVGFMVYFTSHIALKVQWTGSFTSLYKREDGNFPQDLRGKHLSFQLAYDF